ncbi:MAG: hypothetical protein ABIU11_07980 [Chitinophagaceae bacterium]
MERIEALISKLKEQYQQQADPALLLGTVQLLQFELTKLQNIKSQSLGTAKVAVMLPQTNFSNISTAHDKYAPKPVEKEIVQEVIKEKETLLVDNGSVSVVQKNGQLDMVFDPMTEIPTLSHQPKKEVNDAKGQEESLNEKLKQGRTEIIETFKETPVKDLRKAIGINERFVFINELFRGDETMYERSIKTINSFNIYAEAEYWISRELKLKLAWANDNPSVQHFDQLVKRRFS